MKKVLSILITLFLLFSLCSCGKYVSSYTALGLVKSQRSHSCEASFHSLEGELVFKIKAPEDKAEGDISYSVTVEEGEITLYYDVYGEKEELCNINAGESVEDRGGYVEGGKTVYVIIEAAEGTKGSISVNLDN